MRTCTKFSAALACVVVTTATTTVLIAACDGQGVIGYATGGSVGGAGTATTPTTTPTPSDKTNLIDAVDGCAFDWPTASSSAVLAEDIRASHSGTRSCLVCAKPETATSTWGRSSMYRLVVTATLRAAAEQYSKDRYAAFAWVRAVDNHPKPTRITARLRVSSSFESTLSPSLSTDEWKEIHATAQSIYAAASDVTFEVDAYAPDSTDAGNGDDDDDASVDDGDAGDAGGDAATSSSSPVSCFLIDDITIFHAGPAP